MACGTRWIPRNGGDDMQRYIIRRALWMLFILFGISLITFMLTVLLPGDPARVIAGPRASAEAVATLREQWGLNQPVYVQYIRYMGRLIQGDWGRSFYTRRDVLDSILERLPATLQLAVVGALAQLAVGIPVGLISALKQHSIWDRLAMVFSLLGVCTPSFVLGLLLLFYLGFRLPIFPIGGYGQPQHLVLPAITIGLAGGAWYARFLRSSVLEVVNADYVRTARAKGLHERAVVVWHIVRNAIGPVITMIGSDLGYFLGGVLVIERVFAWPGIGLQAWNAIEFEDVPMIMGTVIFSAFFIVCANLWVDLAQVFVDPRVRYD
jgi:peptide/nickel transport system permease protein